MSPGRTPDPTRHHRRTHPADRHGPIRHRGGRHRCSAIAHWTGTRSAPRPFCTPAPRRWPASPSWRRFGRIAVIATIVIVNARLLLYGAALEVVPPPAPVVPADRADDCDRPDIRHRHGKGPDPDRAFRRYWLALGLTVMVGWTSSIAAGMIVGPALPTDLPLDATGTACLLGLLVPKLNDRRALLTAVWLRQQLSPASPCRPAAESCWPPAGPVRRCACYPEGSVTRKAAS